MANDDNTSGAMPAEREGAQVRTPSVKQGSPAMGDNVLARLTAIRKANANPAWINRDLYRLLYKPGIFKLAYERIKSIPGNMTPGSEAQTLDGFSSKVIDDIIVRLRDESFQFSRARRVLIPKPNGSTRPLGVASPRDKVVQEAIRIILESIYDSPHGSYFSAQSFGFRTGRGVHTALQHIDQHWMGTSWFVEGDIKGCFDHIDHHRLLELLAKKIGDQRFLNLIWKALTAGYLEFKVPFNSIAGTPQGSIISPILANVYMHELDVFVDSLRLKYESLGAKKYTREYADNQNALRRVARKLAKAECDGEAKQLGDEIRRLKTLATTLSVWDAGSLPVKIRYVRYADDWLIGLSGTRTLAETLKGEIERFLWQNLKLTLSREKTHIRHAKTESAFFLGAKVLVGAKHPRVISYDRKVGDDTQHVTKRTTVGMVKMLAPVDRIITRLAQKGICDAKGDPKSRRQLAALDDIRIIEEYNSLLLGYLNFYSFVTNRPALRRVAYIVQFSAAKTLAHRHRTSMREIFRRHGARLFVSITGASGKVRTTSLKYPLSFKCRRNAFLTTAAPSEVEVFKTQQQLRTRSKIDQHCVICASDECVEMHHVRHVRKSGKNANEGFDRLMAVINRKQIPVCSSCHKEIHSGRYDGKSLSEFKDIHLAAR